MNHRRVGWRTIGLSLGNHLVNDSVLDIAVSEEVSEDTFAIFAPFALRELERNQRFKRGLWRLTSHDSLLLFDSLLFYWSFWLLHF